jgi:hypothetical protein
MWAGSLQLDSQEFRKTRAKTQFSRFFVTHGAYVSRMNTPAWVFIG